MCSNHQSRPSTLHFSLQIDWRSIDLFSKAIQIQLFCIHHHLPRDKRFPSLSSSKKQHYNLYSNFKMHLYRIFAKNRAGFYLFKLKEDLNCCWKWMAPLPPFSQYYCALFYHKIHLSWSP